MKRIIFLASVLVAFSSGLKAQAYLDDVMLQSFGWDEYSQSRNTSEGGLYEFYYSRAGTLQAHGFDMIWMPPPSKSTGGMGYFPTELYNFSSTSFGTEAQLTKMLTNMNNRGIHPIADVVANHRSGSTGWTDFTNPIWGCDAIVINDEATAAYDAGTSGVSCRPSGAYDTGDGFDGSRDMDHTNATVQAGYKEYLTRLKALGFQGWRWDVAKGFSPSYFGMYIGNSQPYYSVGEYWDSNVDNLKNWITGTYNGGATISAAFDFSLYYNLSNTFATSSSTNQYANLSWSGAMAGLAGQYGFAEKAVTFVDNHDTFSQSSAFVTPTNISKAYTYILTHPGIPCVFAPHYFGGTYTKDGTTRTYASYKTLIDQLIAIRKNAGIDAWSSITVDRAEGGLYAAYIKKRSTDTDAVLAMKIGPYAWTPSGSGWTQVISNTEYSVWTKSAVNVAPNININEASGNFYGTKTVTITASDDSGNAPVVHYTLDGTDPTASSPVYSGAITLTSSATVKAVAFDNLNLSSGVVVRDYTYNAASTGIKIYFKPPTNPPYTVSWPSPKIHYWGVQPAGLMSDAVWGTPVNMTADTANPGWFYYTFTNATLVNFLFRNGDSAGTLGTTKTGDITNVTQDSWYVWDPTSSTYVRSVGNVLATSEVSANSTALMVLQNPATNSELKIRYAKAKGGVFTIFDLSGKLVKTFKASSDSADSETVNLSGLASGAYVIQLKSDAGNAVAKFVLK